MLSRDFAAVFAEQVCLQFWLEPRSPELSSAAARPARAGKAKEPADAAHNKQGKQATTF